MPRFTVERGDAIKRECVGRAMVNAYILYELFDEIRVLEAEKITLSKLLFAQAKRLRDETLGGHILDDGERDLARQQDPYE